MSSIKSFIKDVSPFNNRTEMPKIIYVIKVILFFWVCKFGSEVVGEAFALAAHFACGKNPLQGEMFDPQTIMLISYFGYSILIAVVFLFWKLFQKKTLKDLGFCGSPLSYLSGSAIGTVLVVVSAVLTILTGAIRYNGVFPNIDTKIVAAMLFCFMLQGAMEEILCRGVVQQLLLKKTSVPIAFGVSAALFTIPHLGNMAGGAPAIVAVAVINLILISLIFSMITLRTGSIWAACGLHSIWNYILYSIMGLNLSGKDEVVAAVFDMSSIGENVLNGGAYGIEAGIITTVVLSAALILIKICFRTKNA